MIIGDSLSDAYDMPREDGWVALLDKELGPEVEVINASISGETSSGGARRIDGLMASHDPDVVLVELGGNDGLRGLNPSQVRENLDRIVESASTNGATVLLMQIRLPANLGQAYINRFESIYPEIAEDHGATLVPFFLEDLYDRPGMLMADGIHPTPEAQPEMMEAVRPWVSEALEARCSESYRMSGGVH